MLLLWCCKARIELQWKQRSVIHALGAAVGTRADPIILFGVHILPFPFEDQVIRARSGPLFDDLLFVGALVLELRVRAEAVGDRFVLFLAPKQVRSHNAVEGGVAERQGRVRARRGFDRASFDQLFALLFVFVDPELVRRFVEF